MFFILGLYLLYLDAISGILSTLCYRFPIVGVFYGQCSEICGANHRFIRQDIWPLTFVNALITKILSKNEDMNKEHQNEKKEIK
ncbi:hypothetical protein ANCCAN_05286 [Ancylostoma caninum]|uniref:Cytochrome oxidase subunit II copper A binding domain-containing protein n=1 Tax=Ancylostoma caninum TaxID=29170 RepID=A0A368H044_ANCCA|nr:hypothetical protein ANCCAN_05286 [Ancylostoma caninum]